MSWKASVTTWSWRESSRKHLALSYLMISLWAKSIRSRLIWVRSDGSCGSAASWCAHYHIMVSSAMDLSDFCVKKCKYHLWSRYDISLRCLLPVIRMLIPILSPVVGLNIEVRHALLLSAQLAKFISSHGINKAAWSQKKTVVQTTSDPRDVCWLNRLEREGHEWVLEFYKLISLTVFLDRLVQLCKLCGLLPIVIKLLSDIHLVVFHVA